MKTKRLCDEWKLAQDKPNHPDLASLIKETNKEQGFMIWPNAGYSWNQMIAAVEKKILKKRCKVKITRGYFPTAMVNGSEEDVMELLTQVCEVGGVEHHTGLLVKPRLLRNRKF